MCILERVPVYLVRTHFGSLGLLEAQGVVGWRHGRQVPVQLAPHHGAGRLAFVVEIGPWQLAT